LPIGHCLHGRNSWSRYILAAIGPLGGGVDSGFHRCLCRILVEQLSQHQHDAERRDQILASIERTLSEGIESGKNNRAEQEQEAAKFQRALDAGEMPPLRPFVFTTDYSPGDFATLLQSGGTELLDLETRTALRNDESVIRWGLSRLQRYQKLSDELIVPNLDHDISFFYDPAETF